MGIKKLKKENNILNTTLVDMLGKFDPTKTKKYSQFLVKMLNKRIEEYDSNQLLSEGENDNPLDKVLPNDSWQNMITRNFVCDYIFSWSNMERFIEFTELMEKGLINENDISKYDSWDMLEMNLFEAKNREMFKKSKKEISKIFEDDRYLIFRPLTYLASCSYGYQTKWCTAMINDPGYFYNHSKGVLIYLIDKKDNKKFAFYKNIPQPYEYYEENHEQYAFKTYNQEDKQIDTIQTGLPMNILQVILMECDIKLPTTLPNYKLFSEDEKNNMRKYVGKLPEDTNRGGEGMEEVAEMTIQTVRRQPRLVPLRRIIPSIIEEETIQEEMCTNDLVEELQKISEKLRKEIDEHEKQHGE
jgi:hypothetical protein